MRQVIDGECELVAVGARLPFRPLTAAALLTSRSSRSWPLEDLLGERSTLCQRREVRSIEHGIAASGADRADDFLTALLIAAVHDDERAERTELPRDFLAEAVRRARHERRLARE